MREILFRGRDISGKWHYGVPLMFNEDYVCIAKLNEHNKTVEYKTLGQYTGLTDKNGKKIFEGDIVQGAWETIFAVYYDSDYLQFRAKVKDNYTREIDYYGNSNYIEIIGNIHDNPKLLSFSEIPNS